MAGRPAQVIRADNTKWCDFHLAWEPLEDFRPISDDGAIIRYAARCRLAEQTIRDQKQAIDPAGASIVSRAKHFATDLSRHLGPGCSISYHWVLDELHWAGLIPYLRAAIAPGGTCLDCGRHHDDPSAYQLDHAYPPESWSDWAAHHSRNLWLLDGCNQKKGQRSRDRAWLDARMRDWIRDRQWADHAGEPGWPPYDLAFGPVPEMIYGPVDRHGNPTLFDV
jgi:hypothetical protein